MSNPLGAFGTGPRWNTNEMCISCYKPETTTAMVVHGDIDWLAAALKQFAGLPMDEAMKTAEEIYSDHGATPNARNTSVIRLCRSCAKKTGVPVFPIDEINAGGQFNGVIQPDNI